MVAGPMRVLGRVLVLLAVVASVSLPPHGLASPIGVAAGIDHAEWDRLLRAHVDERGRVDYARWRGSPDHQALRRYLELFAADPDPGAVASGLSASLINAYNAFTIAWILDNPPAGSIRDLPDSFPGRRHRVGGQTISLDDLEHQALRPLVGYRVHAALVCAARSCPPLAREAYRAERLEAQLDAAMRRWLERDDLNRFPAEGHKAFVSAIFDWFEKDFAAAGGVASVLRRHAPPAAKPLLQRPDLQLEHLPYDWSLNQQDSDPAR